MRALLLRAPWVVWSIHAAMMACGLIVVGGVAFGPVAVVVWGVAEVTYLAVVHTMSVRAGATVGAAVHVGCMGSIATLLLVLGVLLPLLWLPLLALVVPTLFEVAVLVSAGPASNPT